MSLENYLTLFAGRGYSGSIDGTGTNAGFDYPIGIALGLNNYAGDPRNHGMYVVDSGSHRIRRISIDGLVTTYAGSSRGYADATGTNAQFNNPIGIAIDSTGKLGVPPVLYVTDYGNNRIRKITNGGLIQTGGVVTTYEKSLQTGGVVTTYAASTQFDRPYGIFFDPKESGDLYVTELSGDVLRITPSGFVSTIYRELSLPRAVTYSSDVGLFVSDNYYLYKITGSDFRSSSKTYVGAAGGMIYYLSRFQKTATGYTGYIGTNNGIYKIVNGTFTQITSDRTYLGIAHRENFVYAVASDYNVYRLDITKPCSVPGTGQYVLSACIPPTTDTVIRNCTPPGPTQYVSAVCTATSDTGLTTASCLRGVTYSDGYQGTISTLGSLGTCQPCSSPGTNQYVKATCTPTSDTVIDTSPSCTAGETYLYDYSAGTPSVLGSQGRCIGCSTPDNSRYVLYVFRVCTPTTDTGLRKMISCTAGETYVTGYYAGTPSTLGSPGTCTNCTLPGPNEYVSAVCTETTNTGISTSPSCTAGQTTLKGYNASTPSTLGSPGMCTNCTLPGTNEYVSAACTPTSDTVILSSLNACQPGKSYAVGYVQGTPSTPGNPGSYCLLCTPPGPDQYVSSVCTPTSDTVFGTKTTTCADSNKYITGYVQGTPSTPGNAGTCQSCSNPTSGIHEYVSAVCTPTTNTRISMAECSFGTYRSSFTQGTASTIGSVTCTPCSNPGINQYVTAVCTPLADTTWATATTPSCASGSTYHGFYRGAFNVLGNIGSCVSTATDPCTEGKYCPQGSSTSTQSNCPSGYYCPRGISTPIPCPVGSYCSVSTEAPSICRAGYYCPEMSIQETQCTEGTYCPKGTGYQIPCPPYTYSAVGQSVCSCTNSPQSTTPNGTVTVTNGKCSVTCNPSFEEYQGRCYSSTRPARTVYMNTDGTETETMVDPNARILYSCPPCYTLQNRLCYFNNKCDNVCPPGYILDDNLICTICPPGKYTLNNQCVDALSGYAATAGTQYQCPAGTYSSTGATSCTLCPKGKYSSTIGATSSTTCILCPAGTYNDIQGAAQCFVCPTDTYNTGTGAKSCSPCTTSCSPGYYPLTQCAPDANSGGACLQCSAGYYCDGKKQTACPVGTISAAGRSVCSACPTGQYSDVNGASMCKNCPAGSFIDGNIIVGGLNSYTKCSVCPVGTYTNSNGNTSCIRCGPGTYYNTESSILNFIDGEIIQQNEVVIQASPVPILLNDVLTSTYSLSMDVYMNDITDESRIILQNSVNQKVIISGIRDEWASPGSLCVIHDTVRVCTRNSLTIGVYTNIIFTVSDAVSLYVDGQFQSSKKLENGFTWPETNSLVYGPGTGLKLKNFFVFPVSINDTIIDQLRDNLNPAQGATSCSLCPAGTYNSDSGGIGASACTPCPPGTGFNGSGGTSVSVCCFIGRSGSCASMTPR